MGKNLPRTHFKNFSGYGPAPHKVIVPTEKQQSSALAQYVSYVELLARSNFSFLQGASHPEEMVLQAMQLGYRGLALCDLNGLYGIVRGWQAVKFPSKFTADEFSDRFRHSFQFHSGAELHLNDQASLALLPMNKSGYTNLCKLITLAKRDVSKGYSKLTLEDVITHSDDLLAFYLPPWNAHVFDRLQSTFIDRLYLPVWKNYTWQATQFYQQALSLEHERGANLFVTQRPLMHCPERKPTHDVLTCMLHRTTLKEAKTRLTANAEAHLKPVTEIAELWEDRPDLVTKTVEIAARLQFSLDELKYEYPSLSIPDGQTSPEFLRELTYQGLNWRYPEGASSKVLELVEKELALINELAYEDYFLTLWDICNFAAGQKILFQGRGSAANSVVCYALGLTAVDPSKFTLMFERFISKERGEPPDIDIDFESGRREEVIQYIYEKYGSEHAAMVCTVICYRSKMALRESAKALEVPEPLVSRMIKYMGRDGLKRLLELEAPLPEWDLSEKLFKTLLAITQTLVGFPRHLGIHTGGFLIAKRPIHECVPIEKATMDKRFVIQWNKDDLTILKMMKIDVLGLGMLTALQKTLALLKAHKGLDYSMASIPADDRDTYNMIQRADTVGVFQIESRAQMGLLPRLKPDKFYDLVVEVAIVRPGPIQGGMVHPFVRRKNGQEPVHYAHPDLRPILQKTFGVPIFQEQLMQIASTVCGFTPGEADELRRIMSSSWKKKELMEGLRKRLINGMLAHGINIAYAEQVYQTIVGFASYGFPESHAASFALITYVSCYLKQHHPDAFTCSLLNSQPMGFYSPRELIGDAKRHGVEFLPLDINISDYEYTLEAQQQSLRDKTAAKPQQGSHYLAVRVGFKAIYGLKEKHIQTLVLERKVHGPFKGLQDLVRRVHLPKHLLMSLGAAGAFESLGLTPRQALWKIQSLQLDRQGLFYGLSGEHLDQTCVADAARIPKESSWEKLTREYHWKGFSTDSHPLKVLRPALSYWSAYDKRNGGPGFCIAKDLKCLPHKSYLRVAGLLSLTQRPPTAKGFAFLTLEDETGFFNIVLMPDVYQKFRLLIADNPLLEIKGTLESIQNVYNIKAEEIRVLPMQRLLKYKPKSTEAQTTITGSHASL
jgi:DNA-directed DNA polymerase III PolC